MDQAQLAVLNDQPTNVPTHRVFLSLHGVSEDLTPRTLLYGYDCDRDTWHVYSDDQGNIFLYIYRLGDESRTQFFNVTDQGLDKIEDLIPNKRLYPQYCDFEFCTFLKRLSVYLPFTTYDEPTAGRHPFAGEVMR